MKQVVKATIENNILKLTKMWAIARQLKINQFMVITVRKGILFFLPKSQDKVRTNVSWNHVAFFSSEISIERSAVENDEGIGLKIIRLLMDKGLPYLGMDGIGFNSSSSSTISITTSSSCDAH